MLLGRVARLAAAAAVAIVTTGCVRRSLTIVTDPPGASVYVNDVDQGISPVTYDFEWYGWHRVMLQKTGYERLDDRRIIRAPLHVWIPIDLAVELLPFPVWDRRTWRYTLTPLAEPPAPTPPEVAPAAPPATSEAPVDTTDQEGR